MPDRIKRWNDETMSNMMGTLLRIGVLLSALIVVFGGILFFIQHPGEIIDYSTFKDEPGRLKNVREIIREAFTFRSRAVIQLGILLLIATPVARVVFSFFGFILEKDRTYTVITFIVLIILFSSVFSNYVAF